MTSFPLRPLVAVLFALVALGTAAAPANAQSASKLDGSKFKARTTPTEQRPSTTRFVDVTTARGIDPVVFPTEGMGTGLAAADFDNDGDVDVFVPQQAGVPDLLYRNDDGVFHEIGALVGVGSTLENRTALWIDYDGDHDLDLLVSNDVEDNDTSYRLYEHAANGQFSDVTVDADMFLYAPKEPGSLRYKRGGFAAGDLNNDGFIDVFATLNGGPSHLFMNDGDGTFSEVGAAAGITSGVSYNHWQAMMADFNEDGWLDIYVAIDFFENALWINQQNGTFVDVAAATNTNILANDMGMAIADFDDDGDLDIHTTNIFEYLGAPVGNVLLRNDTVGSTLWFTDIAAQVGIQDGAWGWGTSFLDFDRDGLLDIVATNGWSSGSWVNDKTRLWRNVSEGTTTQFVDVAPETGMDDEHFGSAMLAFDYDRDGDLDLMQSTMANGPLSLHECRSSAAGVEPWAADEPNWITIRPRMTGTNHYAIGAVVRVTVGSRTMTRLITAGTSFLGQEPAEAHFGLGYAQNIDVVTIEYPDGQILTDSDVSVNEVLTLTVNG